MGRKTQHRFHGSADRFAVLAAFIFECFGNQVTYIADVAGGQGMLARILCKQYNYQAEVVDPRGQRMVGVAGRECEFEASMAVYYDFIVGLHPDEATRAVAEAARSKPAIVIPCCNFWSEEKLGRDALVEAVADNYREQGLNFWILTFPFKGPKNIGLLSLPADSKFKIKEPQFVLDQLNLE